MKRHGAVVVFKPGITPREAANALERIADVLDLPSESYVTVPAGPASASLYLPDGTEVPTDRRVKLVGREFEMIDKINEFDDDIGGPVWYVP